MTSHVQKTYPRMARLMYLINNAPKHRILPPDLGTRQSIGKTLAKIKRQKKEEKTMHGTMYGIFKEKGLV